MSVNGGTWGTKTYNNYPDVTSSPRFKKFGCSTTALAMALNKEGLLKIPGTSTDMDPGTLNEYMAGHNLYNKDHDPNLIDTTRNLHLSWHNLITTNPAALDTILSQNHPVIVRVKHRKKDGSLGGHMVVVTGKENGRYTINDPGFSTKKYLDDPDYAPFGFEGRGYITNPGAKTNSPTGYFGTNVDEPQDATSDNSALSLSVGDNADVLVVDESGRRTGSDSANGTIFQEIPGSVYFRDSLGDDEDELPDIGIDHSIDIVQPLRGTYRITITGLKQGPYSLSLRSYSQDGSIQRSVSISGALNIGSSFTFQLPYQPSSASGNMFDNAQFFVWQHYLDFLGRVPDQGGLDYWTGQITQCGSDTACIHSRYVGVSNAFFYEQEYQQTGSYVYRVYRSAYGNNQPFRNPDPSNQVESNKLPGYNVFAPDRESVVGGANLIQSQIDFATAFVQRPEFLAKYPSSLTGSSYIDSVLGTVKNDLGVDLTGQKSALMNLYNQAGGVLAGRGIVIYRLANDDGKGLNGGFDNRALIDAEYNRAFVATQYFGYLRRDADIGGFLFWLNQVNRYPLRNVDAQNAMVCSFITSVEYQLRFGAVATHSNSECPH